MARAFALAIGFFGSVRNVEISCLSAICQHNEEVGAFDGDVNAEVRHSWSPVCCRRGDFKQGRGRVAASAVSDELLAQAAVNLGASDVGRLNDGGQKAVAKAIGPSGDCILKVVLVDAAAGAHALERARRETQILAEIVSRHVVKLHSTMIELGTPVIAVAWLEEYLDGEDLIENLGTQWPWDQVEAFISQVAAGLREFHDRRVAHRDLSPKNLRKRSDGRWVIIDPGLARFMDLPALSRRQGRGELLRRWRSACPLPVVPIKSGRNVVDGHAFEGP